MLPLVPLLRLTKSYECEAPPNGGLRGWLVVFAGVTLFAVSVGYQYATGVFFKSWTQSEEFSGVAPSTLAWANSIESAGFQCGSIFGGWIIARSSPRVCIAVGAALTTAGAALASTLSSSSPVGLLCLFLGFGVLMGFGSSCSSISAICAVQQYFTTRRGTATGLTVAGSGVGAFILGPLLETLTDAFGWRFTLLSYGIAASGICLACACALIPISLVQVTSKSTNLDVDNFSGPMTSFDATAEVDTRTLVPETPSPTVSNTQNAEMSNTPHVPDTSHTYLDLLKSPGYTTFCCAAIASSVMWYMVPTVSTPMKIASLPKVVHTLYFVANSSCLYTLWKIYVAAVRTSKES